MRVLIVEDVRDEAETFADMVRSQGHVPTVALTAENALECLSASPLDAILLDLYLPGMAGLELLRVLSDRQPHIPVVAISGVSTEEEARLSLDLGAVEFLSKPLTLDRLQLVLDVVELGSLARRLGERLATVNRRRYPRVALSLDVGVEREGIPWGCGVTTDLSPFGMRMSVPPGQLQPGELVRITFQPPDGQPPISVLSLIVRRETRVAAANFIDLIADDFRRLRSLVDRCSRSG
jgi:CheY-like chemotaxis protein